MKRTVIAATIAALLSTTAQAENMVTLYKAKDSYWRVDHFARNQGGRAMCNIGNWFPFNNNKVVGTFFVKLADEHAVEIQVGKTSGWSLKKGNLVPFTITFDDRHSDKWEAKGSVLEKGLVGTALTGEQAQRFLDDVRTSDKMVIHFPIGNEPDWTTDMKGTRKAVEVWKQCVSDIGRLDALDDVASQPGEEEETLPFKAEEPEDRNSNPWPQPKYRGA